MKICIPKPLLPKCQKAEEIGCQSLLMKFFTSAIDFYLSIIGNCLVLLGYLLGKINAEDSPCFVGNFLILVGHFLAMISDVCSIVTDLHYIKHYWREFSVNRFFVVANFLSVIGEYQEFKSALRNCSTEWNERSFRCWPSIVSWRYTCRTLDIALWPWDTFWNSLRVSTLQCRVPLYWSAIFASFQTLAPSLPTSLECR